MHPKKEMQIKISKVKKHFEQSSYYLNGNHNIQYRKEIIREFLGAARFQSILDVACGNAEISLPFLNKTNRLTLLDISESMLDAALRNIPEKLQRSVELIQGDFLNVELPAKNYDLIICTGLLAHIADPIAALQKIGRLLSPNGTVIIQNTNATHPYSYLLYGLRALAALFNTNKYTYNRVSESSIVETFGQFDISLFSRFRYIQSFLLLDKYFTPTTKYNIIRYVFGPHRYNYLNLIGNECIYCFRHSSGG